MLIILIRYTSSLEMIDMYIEEHREFLRRYYEKGVFIASGPREPRIGGVILARTMNQDELDMIIREDPFYREKLAAYSFVPFKPTMFLDEFEKLLHQNKE